MQAEVKEKVGSQTLPFINTHVPKEQERDYTTRYGTIVEKGVSLTEDKMRQVEEKIQDKVAFYTQYPDLWCDEILLPTNSSFSWGVYQRIQLRQQARVPLIHITGARGISKTFTAVFGFIHRAIFYPGSKLAITAPTRQQATQIARQTINDIMSRFPLLRNELKGEPTGTRDHFLVKFKNTSVIEVTAALESTRGSRYDGILVDESRDQEGDLVNGILVPTVSKVRTTYGAGKINPYEPRQVQWYCSSASSKSSYNYEKVLDLFQKMIIQPKSSYVMGLDYRIPVKEGIYPASFVRDIKTDKTMTEQLFAREYLSIFTTENDESWFNFKKMNLHRKMVNSEWVARKNNTNKETFYLISVDVGRKTDNTVATVFKVLPNHGKYRTVVVNIFMLGKNSQSKHFTRQVLDLKKIIAAFNPKEVIIDVNGLGIGLADLMIQTQYDKDGTEYGPLGFYDEDEYKKIQPHDAPRILSAFRATRAINSEMFGNCYARIDSGLVDFLITEQSARSKLLATKKGQKMSLEEKTKFLMPYEMTTKLFEEMGNLRLKRTGAGLDIILEPINSRFPDDRFSSLCIGLRRIKQLEEEAVKKRSRRGGNRKMNFFSGGKRGW